MNKVSVNYRRRVITYALVATINMINCDHYSRTVVIKDATFNHISMTSA